LIRKKNVNTDLKKQYDQLTEAKANLENKLKKVLQEKAAAVAALQTHVQASTSAEPSAQTTNPAFQTTTAQPVATSAGAGR